MPELGHEDLCVLYHAGELPARDAAAFEAHLSSCPSCREALDLLRSASRMAAAAAPEPPLGLGARAAAAVLLQDRPAGLFAPRSLGFALAFAALALAVYFASPRRGEHALKWTNGVEADLARVETELGRLSQEIAAGAEAAELDEDLDGLEESARSLKGQLSRS